ncbi:MAG: AAA family ATPase [Methylomonas sp.]
MKISVTNLGSIKQATVELGGLTVFVGPNGTGKSYLAKVLYGLHKNEQFKISFLNNVDGFYKILFSKNISTIEGAINDLQQLTPDVLLQALPDLINLHAALFKNRLGEFFNDDSDIFKNTNVVCSDFEVISHLKESNSLIPSLLTHQELQDIINGVVYQIKDSADRSLSRYPEVVLWGLLTRVFRTIGGNDTEYFPAARSNYMLTYKEIYRARANEYVGLEDSIYQTLSSQNTRRTGKLIRIDKPTEDFLSRIYQLNSAEQSFLTAIADKLQNRLYGSDSLIVNQPEGALPDFRYRVQNSENNLRLHLASSMVTETSPLLVGFKYWVQPNSLVIIDEPESHLHPEAQSALISVLVEAVNQGLRLILITHSPYILACVNNLIKFGKLSECYAEDSQIVQFKAQHPDLVALEKPVHAYHFAHDGEVKDILLPSGLIDEAEFTEPFDRINELYETMRDIEWEHR